LSTETGLGWVVGWVVVWVILLYSYFGFSQNYLKHICPSSFIFGCHIFVLQLAIGGFKNEKSQCKFAGS
jgi:hypothetical protein